MTDSATLFIAYSHKDEKFKDYVVRFFTFFEMQVKFHIWDDRCIKGGTNWRKEIETSLVRAKIAILLVTRHSLTSDFILDKKVSTMLRRRHREGLLIYPIVVSPCDLEAVPWLHAMNLRPKNGKALNLFSPVKRDMAMVENQSGDQGELR